MILWVTAAMAAPMPEVLGRWSVQTAPATLSGPILGYWPTAEPRHRGPAVGGAVAVPVWTQEDKPAVLVQLGGGYDGVRWNVQPGFDLQRWDLRVGAALLLLRDAYTTWREDVARVYSGVGGGLVISWARQRWYPDLVTPAPWFEAFAGVALGKGIPRVLVEARLEVATRADTYAFVMQTDAGEVTLTYRPSWAGIGVRAGVGFR